MGKDNRFAIALDMTEVWEQLNAFEARLKSLPRTKSKLPDGITDSIEELSAKVAAFKSQLEDIASKKINASTFTSFTSSMTKDIGEIGEKVKLLDASMYEMIQQMSGAESSGFTRWLTQIRSGFDEAGESVKTLSGLLQGVYSATAGRANIEPLIGTKDLKSQVETLKRFQSRAQHATTEGEGARNLGYMWSDVGDFVKAVDEAYAKYEDIDQKLAEMAESGVGITAYKEAMDEAIRATQTINDLISSAVQRYGPNIWDATEKGMGKVAAAYQKLEKARQNSVEYLVPMIDSELANAEAQLKAAEARQAKPQMNKARDQISVPITIDENQFLNNVMRVIKSVQENIESNPLQVTFTLVSKYKAGKYMDAMKALQDQINTLGPENTNRKTLQMALDDVSTSFGREITLGLRNDLALTKGSILNFIKQIRENINEDPLVIHPVVEFDEKDVEAFRDRVKEVASSLDEVVSKAAAKQFGGKSDTPNDDHLENFEKRMRVLLGSTGAIAKAIKNIGEFRLPRNQDFGAASATVLARELKSAAASLQVIREESEKTPWFSQSGISSLAEHDSRPSPVGLPDLKGIAGAMKDSIYKAWDDPMRAIFSTALNPDVLNKNGKGRTVWQKLLKKVQVEGGLPSFLTDEKSKNYENNLVGLRSRLNHDVVKGKTPVEAILNYIDEVRGYNKLEKLTDEETKKLRDTFTSKYIADFMRNGKSQYALRKASLQESLSARLKEFNIPFERDFIKAFFDKQFGNYEKALYGDKKPKSIDGMAVAQDLDEWFKEKQYGKYEIPASEVAKDMSERFEESATNATELVSAFHELVKVIGDVRNILAQVVDLSKQLTTVTYDTTEFEKTLAGGTVDEQYQKVIGLLGGEEGLPDGFTDVLRDYLQASATEYFHEYAQNLAKSLDARGALPDNIPKQRVFNGVIGVADVANFQGALSANEKLYDVATRALTTNLEKANGELDAIANNKMPANQDFGAERAHELEVYLNNAVDALGQLGASSPLRQLGDMLSGWSFSDLIEDRIGEKQGRKRRLERSAVVGSDNRIYGQHVFDSVDSSRGAYETMKALPDGVMAMIDLHSHANNIAAPSLAVLDETMKAVEGDLIAWAASEIPYALIAARDNILAFDADNFYTAASRQKINGTDKNIDFTDPTTQKILAFNQKLAINKYNQNPAAPVMDAINEYGVGMTKFADNISSLAKGLYEGDFLEFDTKKFLKIFAEEHRQSGKSIQDVFNAAFTAATPQASDILKHFQNEDELMQFAGLSGKNDVVQYFLQKVTSSILNGVYSKNVSQESIDAFEKEYAKTVGENRAKNTLPLTKEMLNLGVGDLYNKYMKTYKSADEFVNDNPFKLSDQSLNSIFNIDDGVISRIDELSTSLKSLLGVVKEFTTVSYDTSLFEEELRKSDMETPLSEGFLSIPGLNKEQIEHIDEITHGADKSSATYYHDIAQSIVAYLDEAGVAIDEFATKRRTLNAGGGADNNAFSIDFDTSSIDGALKKLETIKNAVNSFRKEFKSVDFSNMAADITPLVDELKELSDVLQRATGVYSESKLKDEFKGIQDAAKSFGKKSLAKKEKDNRAEADAILKRYQDYIAHGGSEDVKAIGGESNLNKYLVSHYQQSITAAQEEVKTLADIPGAVTQAANATNTFADANSKVAKSINPVVDGFGSESQALYNLSKLIKQMNDLGKGGIKNIAESFERLHTALNKPLDNNSLLAYLRDLVNAGQSLSDMVTITKTNNKEAKQSKRAQERQQRIADATAILDGKREGALENAAMDAQSLGKLEFINVEVNSDGFIEAKAYVKDYNDELLVAKMLSEDGINFEIKGISTATKQALQFDKFLQRFNELNEASPPTDVTDDAIFDKTSNPEVWKMMIEYARQYTDTIGNLTKVQRQVRQDADGFLRESWSFFGENDQHVTVGPGGVAVASHQNLLDVEGIANLWMQASKTAQEYFELRGKVASGDASNLEIARLQDLEKEYIRLKERLNEVNATIGVNNVAQASATKAQQTAALNYINYLNGFVASNDKKLQGIENVPGKTLDYSENVARTREDLTSLQNLIKSFGDKPWELFNEENLQSAYELTERISSFLSTKQNKKDITYATTAQIDTLAARVGADLTNNTAMGGELRGRFEDLASRLQEVRVQANDVQSGFSAINKTKFDSLVGEFKALHAEMLRTGQTGKGFWAQVSGAMSTQTAQLIARYFSLHDIIRYARQAVQTVNAVDTSLKELQKVSSGTDQQMAKAFDNAAITAQNLGATITDVIDSTADWSRLGYSLPDAQELARVTTMYQNIAKGIDQKSASEYMVSTLQGFQLQASDAESIVDSINQVANNFAIDQAGIGEALQRSAASLYAAHTDLNKSIALVTTGNAILQNPESVGTAFKTLSARLRGAKNELEELGEDEAEVAATTSNLRQEVMALTGFDIMSDKDTYKDVYDILLGIGQAWGQLTDAQQAALAEKLAGKRMASVLYAVLNNTEQLEAAYATAMDSAGSAQRAQDIYASSVQYSIDRAKASLQELASDFISSDLLKGIIDFGNGIIKMLDSIVEHIGFVGTALMGFGAGNVIKGLMSPKGSFITNGIKSVWESFVASGTNIETTKSIKSLLATPTKDTYTNVQKLIGGLSSPDDAVRVLSAAGVTDKTAQYQIISKGMVGLEDSAAKAAVGLDVVDNSLDSVKDGVSNVSRASLGLKGMLSSPIFWGAIAITTVVALIQKYNQNIAELRKRATEIADEWKTSTASMRENYQEVIKLRQELDAGGLSDAEQYRIKEQIYDIQKQIVEQYGEQADGINLVNGELATQLELLRNINKEEALRKYDENYDVFEQAQKDRIVVGDLADSNVLNLPGVSELVQSIAGLSVLDIDTSTIGDETIHLTTDIMDAHDAVNDYIVGLENLKEQYANNVEYQMMFDNAIEQANKYLHSHSAAWSDQIDTLNQMNSLIFAKEGGSVLFADFEEAAEAYNKALHMGDNSEILETRDALTDAFDALTMFMKAKGLDANDFTDLFDSVVEGIDTTAEKAFNAAQEINEAMETIGLMNGGNVDLFNRPRVPGEVMRSAYSNYAGDYSTVHTATFSNAAGNVAANFTPIMTDDKGKFIGVLNAEQLQAYAEAVIDGVQTDTLNLQIGAFFEGEDAIARAEEAAERIHELQANVSWTNPTISNKDYRDLGKYLQAVIDRGLDKVDVRSLLSKTSVRRSFEDQMSRIRLKDLSVALGFDISNEAELSAFIDLLYQSGVVAGDASDAIKESADAYNTLKTNVDKAIESVTKINAAMSESAAGTGISADSLKDLRDIYGDDLSYALETTAHGYHLNVTEMNKLQKKQESMVRSNFMGTLAEQYEKLDDANNHLMEAYQSGDFASAAQWSASISEINGEITKIQDLQMEWDAATSAYNRYLAAKSGTDEHSMYDTIQGGYKEVNDILAQGWTMSDDVVSYLKLVTGEEAKSVEDVERLWTSLGKTIEGTKFSIKDFFTADDNGPTSDGIFNFFDTLYALQDKVGEHWVDITEDGKYSFDFGFGGDQRVADMFSELTGVQIGVEAIQAIAQASRSIGFVNLSLEAPIASLEELKTEAEGAQQALVNLGDTSLSDINLNTTTFDETAAEIAKVQQYITDIEGSELTPEIKTERIEYANQVLEYLLRTEQGFSKELPLNVTVENLSSQIAEAEEAVAGLSKTKGKVKLTLDDATVQNLHMLYSMRETLSQPAVMSVDTSQIGGAMGNAIALIQQYESLASQLQVLKELSSQGIDVSAQTLEAEQKLQGVASQISALKSEDLQLVPGIDAESFQAQMAELSEYAVNLDTRLNEDKLAEIESQINGIKVDEIKVNAVVDDTEVVNLKSELRQMNGTTYTTKLGVEITNKASFIDIYNKWKEMKNGGGVNPSGRGGSSGSTNNGGLQHTTQLYGTAHTRGTAMSAFAHGNWGLEENQEALINELGPEIIVRDGQWFTVNSGYPTFASLKKGDVIFNHRQSEQILRNGRLTGSHAKMIGASHLEGTAFSSGGSASRKKLTTNSKSSSSSSGKSSGNGNSAADKAAKEVQDWIEVRLQNIAASLERFKTMADYYVTFTYQNRELNKAIQQAKTNTAQNEAAYNKYIKKANSIKLSSNLKKLVREGDINLKSYDDKTQQLISEYSEWYSKAQECKNTIIELKKEQLDLSRQKLDNIIDDYEAVNNYLSATYDNWMKLNELAEKKQGVGNVEYLKNAAAYQNSTIKELRQAEQELTAEMNRQLKSGAMVKGSQEWEEAMTDIRDVQNAIKDAELEIYNLNEAIREVNWSGWNRIIARLEHYDSQLDTTIGLISDLTAYNKDASITDAGLSAMNMNALGLKYARLEIEDYTYAMETLRKELANGTINQEQFNEQLFDYAEKQMSAVEEAKKYREAIISLVKDGIDAETAAMEKLIDTRKEALEKQKEADDYAKKVNDQTKEINKIRAQIAALSGDTTLAAQAKVAKLRADLADKEADLEETRRDHTYDTMIQGYDDELEKFKEIQDEKIEALSYSLANQETVISNVLDETMDQYRKTAEILNQIAMEYGIKLEDFIVDPWNKATSAAQVYKQAIAGLETSQNETGDTNIITAGAVNVRSEGTDITTGNMVNVSSATDTVKLKESITSPFYTGKKAAKGAKNARGLYLTDEQGLGSEALITKDGVLRQLDSDTVFSKKQTDVLWDLSKMPLNSMLNNASKIVRADTSVNMHYDSMLTVNGNVDKDALPGLQDLLKQACEYTKQDISATFSKMGLRGVL